MLVLVSRQIGNGRARIRPRDLGVVAVLAVVAAFAAGPVTGCAAGDMAVTVGGVTVGAGRRADPPTGGPPDSLILLHTNDTHAQLLPFERSNGALAGGAAARAERIRKERERSRHTILLDGGDVFQGTPFFSLFGGVPDYRAMSMMGYASGALGNHDLDNGPAAWIRTAKEAAFPVRSANVFVDAESSWARKREEVPSALRRGARWIGGKKVPDSAELVFLTEKPWDVVERVGPVTDVAFFGLTTPDLERLVLRSRNGGVAVGDPIAAARYLVPRLREQASMVICLSHMGEDMDRKLAERVPGIDVIVGGHSHTPLHAPVLVRNTTPNGYGGTVIVQAGYRGEYLGRLALYLEGKRLQGYSGRLLRVNPEDGEDARVASMLRPYAEEVSKETGGVVFRSPARIPQSGLRDGETPLGNFVADVVRWAGEDADIGLINSGGIRAAMPAGDVTVADVHTILPFDNKVVVVEMAGWQVRQLLDRVAQRLGKGGFLQVSGVKFVITRDRASYIRVGEKEEALNSDRVYRVATVDYLAEGGDGYTHFEKGLGITSTGVLLREAAVRFLEEFPRYEFRKESRIRWEGSTSMFRGGRVGAGGGGR
ncbi:MAG TPA: bifunctional UDP-sugar hydrolase/5'-nucleotidase [Candidatus Eisenbacteria bacterium]|nr:bifunctional UDP-sugar hydrolase/5'-nucleotidase [Candidatus Eisenbacteria bacterium]